MSRRPIINAAFTVAGVALLVWQINQLGQQDALATGSSSTWAGLQKIGDGLSRVGAGFVLILLLAFVRFVLRSYAWLALLGRPAPLQAAIAATISGDAIGNLALLGPVASEPAKAAYLGRYIDGTQAFAALAAENFFYVISVAAYVVVGSAALLLAFDTLPDAVRLAGIAACLLMGVVFVVVGWVAWQRPAIASALLSRIPSRRVAALVETVREFEVRTYGSAGHEGARLGVVALAEAGFHLGSLVESWLTLYLLTGAWLPLHALILDSVSRAISAAFKLIPLRVGVDEVGSETVAGAIGLAAGVGLQAALVRKVRMIVWAAIGLTIWALRGRPRSLPS